MTVGRALILAGERPGGDPLARRLGVANKALIELAGRPLLGRVLDAVAAAGVARIAVSTNEPQVRALATRLGAEVLPSEARPSLSVMRGVEALGTPVLITTSDHALLRPEWIARFVADAPTDADLCVLMARRETVEAAAPGTKRTYLRFADGAWSGCNLFLARTPEALAAIALWRRIEADRKRPWRIALKLGPSLLLPYALGRLTLPGALERLGRLCGAKLAVVPTPFGLAAVDVDKPEDLELVRGLFGEDADVRR